MDEVITVSEKIINTGLSSTKIPPIGASLHAKVFQAYTRTKREIPETEAQKYWEICLEPLTKQRFHFLNATQATGSMMY